MIMIYFAAQGEKVGSPCGDDSSAENPEGQPLCELVKKDRTLCKDHEKECPATCQRVVHHSFDDLEAKHTCEDGTSDQDNKYKLLMCLPKLIEQNNKTIYRLNFTAGVYHDTTACGRVVCEKAESDYLLSVEKELQEISKVKLLQTPGTHQYFAQMGLIKNRVCADAPNFKDIYIAHLLELEWDLSPLPMTAVDAVSYCEHFWITCDNDNHIKAIDLSKFFSPVFKSSCRYHHSRYWYRRTRVSSIGNLRLVPRCSWFLAGDAC